MELPRLIKIELVKLFYRRGTWIASSLVVFMPIIVFLYFLATTGSEMEISGFSVIQVSIRIGKMFGSIIVVIIAVGLLCGEAREKTLRTSLTKPVSRENVLISKFLANVVYILALLAAVSLIAAVAGLKWGYKIPEDSTPKTEIIKILLGILIYALELTTVASFCFLISVLTDTPMIAYVVGLVFNATDFIQTAFEKIAPYTYPYHIEKAQEAVFGTFFSTSIDWRLLGNSAGFVAIYILGFLLLATIIFERKDIKV